MCGIAGVLNLDGKPVSSVVLRRMTDAMGHRGPDGWGAYVDGPVGLGHRRLAIIDLSAAGHQPMSNETGTVVGTYGGEVYNFRELRVELEGLGHRFHSNTDSEVVVHAYEAWGDACVERFNGMFAFAIWDSERRRLLLARDRHGVKPLYWYHGGGSLIFGSEIKAILEHPGVRRDVSYAALNEYFTFQNVFSDLTLFDGIRLLPAGHTLTADLRSRDSPTLHKYWDYSFEADRSLTPKVAEGRLHDLFVQAVTRQLVSDVPVGSYLSAGIDSNAITAVAVQSLPRMQTFTGGFDLSSASGLELGFDERLGAEAMANLLKTEHYEVVMHAGDMERVLPDLIWHLEDLRVGQSYPNYYVSRLASKFVKVVLSGSGGDELFGGYPWRYFTAPTAGRADFLQRYFGYWQRLVSDNERPAMFRAATRDRVDGNSPFESFAGVFDGFGGTFETADDSVTASLYFELKTFLPGLLLVEDKLSMAHGLETRVPFLDNDLVDFATSVPSHLKLRDMAQARRLDENDPLKRRSVTARADGKALLRDAMARILPSDVRSRPKQGFSAPDASWFRGESIEYINRLLGSPKAMLYEYFEPFFVQRVLEEHTSGRMNRRLLIWSLLSFEWWCRAFLSGAALEPTPPARTRHERRAKGSASLAY